MQIKMPATLASLAALTVGGLWWSNRIKFRTGDVPGIEVERRVVVRTPGARPLLLMTALGLGAWAVARRMGSKGSASSVEQSIDINVPVSTAYNQWTQFEQFPRFMASVEEVTQIDDTHQHWRAVVAGKSKEWDVEITEQVPDQRIAWRSIGGVPNAGVVRFDKVSESCTRVTLQMDYQPESAEEKIGAALGGVKLTAKGNLKRFKELLEQRGVETGAWRGAVVQH